MTRPEPADVGLDQCHVLSSRETSSVCVCVCVGGGGGAGPPSQTSHAATSCFADRRSFSPAFYITIVVQIHIFALARTNAHV
jgi:hypothetical protein